MEELLIDDVNLDHLLNKSLPRLRELVDKNPVEVYKTIRQMEYPIRIFLENVNDTIGQHLICITILERYERAFIEKNQSMFDTIRHDLLTFFLRKNAIMEQTIVKGCASLIASHIFDCDHPYVSKNLQPHQTFSANIQQFVYWRKNIPKKSDLPFIVSCFLSGKHMKRQPMVSELPACEYKYLLNNLKYKDIHNLMGFAVGSSTLVSDDWQFDRIMDFFNGKLSYHDVKGCYHFFNNVMTPAQRKDFPESYKNKQLPGMLERSLTKLSNQGKKELKWFVSKLIIPNENLVKVWDSIFVEDSKDADLVLNIVDNFVTDNDQNLPEISVEEVSIEIQEVSDDKILDTLLNEESKPVEIDTIQVFEPFEFSDDFEELIKSLNGNEKGQKTAEYIKNFLHSKTEHMSCKDQSDQLCRAFESCLVKDWPDWLKFAVMNVIIDKKKIFDESSNTEYEILSQRQYSDYTQFKQNRQKIQNIIADKQYYSSWQRVIS